ncbi:hypothetical protein MRX96_007069 [Rhipicephalus microplus]
MLRRRTRLACRSRRRNVMPPKQRVHCSRCRCTNADCAFHAYRVKQYICIRICATEESALAYESPDVPQVARRLVAFMMDTRIEDPIVPLSPHTDLSRTRQSRLLT